MSPTLSFTHKGRGKRIEDEAAARVLAEEQKQEDLKKIRVQIKHDNDPTTNTYAGKLEAIAADKEDDEISYLYAPATWDSFSTFLT